MNDQISINYLNDREYIKRRIFKAFPEFKITFLWLQNLFIANFQKLLENVQGFKTICCIGYEFVFWLLPLFGTPRIIILNKRTIFKKHISILIQYGVKLDSFTHIVDYDPYSTDFSHYLIQFNPDLIILGAPGYYNYLSFPYMKQKDIYVTYPSKPDIKHWWFNSCFLTPYCISKNLSKTNS